MKTWSRSPNGLGTVFGIDHPKIVTFLAAVVRDRAAFEASHALLQDTFVSADDLLAVYADWANDQRNRLSLPSKYSMARVARSIPLRTVATTRTRVPGAAPGSKPVVRKAYVMDYPAIEKFVTQHTSPPTPLTPEPTVPKKRVARRKLGS